MQIKPKPFLKWAGGKRQLLEVIRNQAPENFERYIEPFVGAGAILFGLEPEQAIINDVNAELINCYQVIRDSPKELLDMLSEFENTKEQFLVIRSWDREPEYAERTAIEKAARMIYLNKTCFNGLYRVNSKNQFNVPFGKYKNAKIVDCENILAISDFLKKRKVNICNDDFARVLRKAKINDFIYLDPPYDPINETSSFTSYTEQGFGREDQIRLKNEVDNAVAKGAKVLLSNSSTPFIRELYKEYEMQIVKVKRSINADATRRGRIDEVLIKTY